jgi:hypothetical protein
MTHPDKQSDQGFRTFGEFYPYYLSEHSNPICRGLHYIGSIIALGVLLYCLITAHFIVLPIALIAGYGFAWIGHFFFEHNRPATFIYPHWSFIGDWVMLKDFLTGQLQHKLAAHKSLTCVRKSTYNCRQDKT